MTPKQVETAIQCSLLVTTTNFWLNINYTWVGLEMTCGHTLTTRTYVSYVIWGWLTSLYAMYELFPPLKRGYHRNMVVHFLSLGQLSSLHHSTPHDDEVWDIYWGYQFQVSNWNTKVRIADDTQTGRNRDPVLFVGNHNQLLIEYQLYLSGSPKWPVVIHSQPEHTCRMSYEDG